MMELFTISHITIIATGGYGKVYYSATSATCTGGGNAMVLELVYFARYRFVQSSNRNLWSWNINSEGEEKVDTF